MNAGSMAEGWHYANPTGGAQSGPLSWEQLCAVARGGGLSPDDLVWHPQLPGWVPASQVPGLPAAPSEVPTAGRPVMSQPSMMASQPASPRVATAGRRSNLLAWLIPLIAVIIVGAGLGSYFGFFYHHGSVVAENSGGTSTSTTAVQATTTTESPMADLGVSDVKAIDPAKLAETAAWGVTPVNRVCVVLTQGKSRTDAESIAATLGGTVVGQIDYVNLYEIETAGTTEADLQASVEQARALPGVKAAMADVEIIADTEIWGVRQTPLNDPAYADGRDGGYKLIGAQKAWDYIKGSGLPIADVHAGWADFGLWKAGGDFNGGVTVDFPDHGAAETPPEQVQNEDGELVDDPLGSHGTMTMGQFCGDPGNGGTAGLAAVPLDDKLDVSFIDVGSPPYGVDTGVPAKPDPNDPSVVQWGDGKFYSLGGLKALLTLVESGAKVINCSWSSRPNNETPEWAAAYQQFFEKMSVEHPDVLFVCSAGNRGKTDPYKDGAITWPGGRKLPNMITVGNVMNDGTLRDTSNRQNDQPGHEYEVTLAAPGHEAVQGLDTDGTPLQAGMVSKNGMEVTGGGTSAAAPMVSAAAAMLLSINPELTAGEIKQILCDTAQPGPAELGGKVLAIDAAVLEVINRQREEMGLPQVTGDELENGGAIDAVAISQEGEPNTWKVKAIIKALPSVKAADITISATTGTKIEGQLTQSITAPGEVVWIPVTVPNEVAEITVTRNDNGAASVISFEQIDLNGTWVGTYTFTDMTVDQDALQAQTQEATSSADTPEEGCAGGAGIAAAFAVLDKLKGVPIPMTMEITADMNAGTGEAVITVDLSSLDLGEGVDVGDPQPTTVPFTFAGQVLTFQLPTAEGSANTMKATVSKQGDAYVLTGTAAGSGTGYSMTVAVKATKQE